eukprot:gene17217-biopygen2933
MRPLFCPASSTTHRVHALALDIACISGLPAQTSVCTKTCKRITRGSRTICSRLEHIPPHAAAQAPRRVGGAPDAAERKQTASVPTASRPGAPAPSAAQRLIGEVRDATADIWTEVDWCRLAAAAIRLARRRSAADYQLQVIIVGDASDWVVQSCSTEMNV